MAETISLLREKATDCKIVVGGAVLTADYAARIGADKYAGRDGNGEIPGKSEISALPSYTAELTGRDEVFLYSCHSLLAIESARALRL